MPVPSSALAYVYLHRGELQEWLDNNFNCDDHFDLTQQFVNSPRDAQLIIEDFKRTNLMKYNLAKKEICSAGSKIVLVLGGRGMGKTAFTYLMAYEAAAMGRQVVFYNAFKFPHWAIGVFNMSQVPDGSFLVLDEAAIFTNARNFDKTNQLVQLLPILRHRGITVFFCSQSSAMVDVNIMRMADVLIFKPMVVLAQQFERNNLFSPLDQRMIPQDKSEVYYKSSNLIMKFHHGLMPGYEGNFDKTFGRITDEKVALSFAEGLFKDASMEIKEVRSILSNFGYDKPLAWWTAYLGKL